jgi:hypothetical protein
MQSLEDTEAWRLQQTRSHDHNQACCQLQGTQSIISGGALTGDGLVEAAIGR